MDIGLHHEDIKRNYTIFNSVDTLDSFNNDRHISVFIMGIRTVVGITSNIDLDTASRI